MKHSLFSAAVLFPDFCKPVSLVAFAKKFKAAKASQGVAGRSVSMPEASPSMRYFLSPCGLFGFALDLSNGNLCGVFKHISCNRSVLSNVIEQAEQVAADNGLPSLALDCFEPLAQVYARYGFTETGRLAFDWAYAPADWVIAQGTPDVVLMSKPVLAYGRNKAA